MEKFNLQEFFKGWFIGAFEPTILNTKDFEIAIKRYIAGDNESRHLHKISKEYTIIISGKVKMNETEYEKDDIIVIDQNESTDFYCIEDTVTCVVKIPSSINDKYLV